MGLDSKSNTGEGRLAQPTPTYKSVMWRPLIATCSGWFYTFSLAPCEHVGTCHILPHAQSHWIPYTWGRVMPAPLFDMENSYDEFLEFSCWEDVSWVLGHSKNAISLCWRTMPLRGLRPKGARVGHCVCIVRQILCSSSKFMMFSGAQENQHSTFLVVFVWQTVLSCFVLLTYFYCNHW